MQITERQLKKFERKIDITESGCHEWMGAKIWSGYGRVTIDYKQYLAHRISWMVNFGEIEKGMFVCHTCDNRCCVNPDHLFLGTQAENMQDASQKGRNRTKPRPQLTKEAAESIREEYPSKTIFALADEYGVTPVTISHVINNRTFST